MVGSTSVPLRVATYWRVRPLQFLPCDSSTAAHFTTKPVLGNVSAIATHIPKIVSGGQTGADRAALDWALSRGIECGGWCPKGRKAEDGRIAANIR
jgi:hypothetical protein